MRCRGRLLLFARYASSTVNVSKNVLILGARSYLVRLDKPYKGWRRCILHGYLGWA
jgi:hypothetical protein